MAFLIKERGVNAGEIVEIASPICLLGRRSDCDIQEVFDGNERVSRQHAKIEDLESRNGTYLNGRRVDRRSRLREADKIEICGIGFRFQEQRIERKSLHDVQHPREFQTIVLDQGPSAGIMAAVPLASGDGSAVDSALASPKRKLEGLVKLLESLGSSIETEELLDNLLEGLFVVFPAADRGFVAMRDSLGETVKICAARFRCSGFRR